MKATILGTDMSPWPPVATHVRLDEPFQGHTDVAILLQGPEYGGDQHCALVIDATEDGLPTPGMMMALAKYDYGTVQGVISQMGYVLAEV